MVPAKMHIALTERQKLRVIDTLRDVVLTIVLPTLVLWALCFWLFKDFYLQVLIFVVVVRLIVLAVRKLVSVSGKMKAAKDVKKIKATEEMREEYLKPMENVSPFVRQFMAARPERNEEVLYDYPQSWTVLVRMLFNPYSERTVPPPGAAAQAFYSFFRMIISFMTTIWFISLVVSFIIAGLYVAKALGSPEAVWYEMLGFLTPEFTWWYLIWVAVLAVLSAMWVYHIVNIWQKEHNVLTRTHFFVVTDRWPYYPSDPKSGELRTYHSATPSKTVLGKWKWLNYAHMRFYSTQEPEPIPERFYVRNPERFLTIFQEYAKGEQRTTTEPKSV